MASSPISNNNSSSSNNNNSIVGIVGATGAVGIEILQLLQSRNFPVSNIHLFASDASAGKTLRTKTWGEVTLQKFSLDAARACDFVFLAVSGSFATKVAPDISAMPGGAIVIDNSSAFRRNPEIPLIIPEINGHILTPKNRNLIANPNCTTAIASMALWPIYCRYGLKRVIVSTYQAASGAGAKGMEELRSGSAAMLEGSSEPPAEIFAHPLPFNVIPHIDTFQPNGYTREEMKVRWELQKIFNDSSIAVSCTAVRIPTMRAHAEAITIETLNKVSASDVRSILSVSPGVTVVDDGSKNQYPMPLTASEKEDVEVGRIRSNDVFGSYGLDLFVCGDQLLRGAALNAVLIAEYLLKNPDGGAVPPSSVNCRRIRRQFNYCNIPECVTLCSIGVAVLATVLFYKRN